MSPPSPGVLQILPHLGESPGRLGLFWVGVGGLDTWVPLGRGWGGCGWVPDAWVPSESVVGGGGVHGCLGPPRVGMGLMSAPPRGHYWGEGSFPGCLGPLEGGGGVVPGSPRHLGPLGVDVGGGSGSPQGLQWCVGGWSGSPGCLGPPAVAMGGFSWGPPNGWVP